ncbi:hypothetical protein G7047_09090 [Diaphorobacter sp. HDW4A]|uniref:hypothetical protein n=1 Tax=Diaphorobacter sp. HDW4A TaxID=2714924 RepID=UPI00140CC344|nr:hypothetical protein [Diaphorobacter sp. HDW4A]QIL80038.1 hypothetical protein G7047_09090 [Diaphorobacter sp. HDW4A]
MSASTPACMKEFRKSSFKSKRKTQAPWSKKSLTEARHFSLDIAVNSEGRK